jgi:hypothetical protein
MSNRRIQESGGYEFRVDREGDKVVLGMATFEVQEARKLAARVLEICEQIESE